MIEEKNFKITNKTEALDYLYYINTGALIKDDTLYKVAKSYFTESELSCLDLGPEIHCNHCFSSIAKRHKI